MIKKIETKVVVSFIFANFAPLFGLLCPNYALLGVWKGTPLGAQGEGPNMRRNEYLKIIYKSSKQKQNAYYSTTSKKR
ncbi:MAG: hypothetical protein K5899_04000 [Bacteroidaceae bacterium]|nr:hypothetical protein [Bacteroidaceae bacterium]